MGAARGEDSAATQQMAAPMDRDGREEGLEVTARRGLWRFNEA